MNPLERYIITSPLFQGSVEYKFNHSGSLELVAISADMEWKVARWFLGNSRPSQQELKAWVESPEMQIKKLKLVVQVTELTYEMMYKAYGVYKDRKRAEQRWKALDYGNQLRAYLYIAKYNQDLKLSGRQKMELKTYLNAEIWND
jgi:hypothetical protein